MYTCNREVTVATWRLFQFDHLPQYDKVDCVGEWTKWVFVADGINKLKKELMKTAFTCYECHSFLTVHRR